MAFASPRPSLLEFMESVRKLEGVAFGHAVITLTDVLFGSPCALKQGPAWDDRTLKIQKHVNPYEIRAREPPTEGVRQRPGWVRRFIVLNATLLLLPIVVVLIGFIALQIQLTSEADVIVDRDSVTYEYELVGVSVSGPSFLTLAFYLSMPNLVLLCWLGLSSWKGRTRAS